MTQETRTQEIPTPTQASGEMTAVELALIVGGSTDPTDETPGMPHRPGQPL
jgi:hypothetical protein